MIFLPRLNRKTINIIKSMKIIIILAIVKKYGNPRESPFTILLIVVSPRSTFSMDPRKFLKNVKSSL